MKLISGALMGGLGNQLFIAAHALAQGLKHDRNVVFIPLLTHQVKEETLVTTYTAYLEI